MRAVLILAGCLLLGGCNMVVTQKPLFTSADAIGTPAMRPGVWLAEDQDCKFDSQQPAKAWPDCARGLVIQSDGAATLLPSSDQTPKISLTFIPGDPLILQAHIQTLPEEGSPGVNSYIYQGGLPTSFDVQGRVVAATFWFVLCRAPEGEGYKFTTHLLPGLTVMQAHGANASPYSEEVCTTASKTALRAAAKANEAWISTPASKVTQYHGQKLHWTQEYRWLRDGGS